MAWKKSPPELVERFQRSLPDDPRVQSRSMFGFPCAFVQGQMFAGLFEDRVFVRLSETQRATLLDEPGARPFEPTPGRAMREYVELPRPLTNTRLADWLQDAMRYAAALPGKAAKRPSRATPRPAPLRPTRTRR